MADKHDGVRVAAFFAEGLEECEALVPVDVLFRANIACDKVSISDNLAVTSSHGVTVVCDRTIFDDDFSFDDYDMLFLPGGMPGTKNLRACKPLCDAVSRFVREGRDVATLCSDPVVVDGNVMTSQGLGTALELGLSMIRRFQGQEATEAIKGKVVYIERGEARA